MSTQPEALRLADELEQAYADEEYFQKYANELRRLFELAHEQHSEIYGLRLQVKNMYALNQELLETLKKIANLDYRGTNYTENILVDAIAVARAAIAKAERQV